LSFSVLPAVDISNGRCIRPLQGKFGQESIYSDDPMYVALGFCRAGARWLHIVDLDGVRTGVASNRELILDVVRGAACPVQAGGGVKNIDEVTEIVAAGAGRAVLEASVLDDRPSLRRMCATFGDRIAVRLDANGSDLEAGSWTVNEGVPVLEAVSILEAAGVSMFVYNDLGRDGQMSGPDLEGLARLAHATARPIFASGGVASIEDVRSVARLYERGVRGAIIGRALYENKFGIVEAQHRADEIAGGRDQNGLIPEL
jgi:phosphoribosylformimino-5-aminoimidazole carboxamide ribotide isomerase